jgi:hypothetical protein
MKTLHVLNIFHEFTEKPRSNNEITVNSGKAKIISLPENGDVEGWTYFKGHY